MSKRLTDKQLDAILFDAKTWNDERRATHPFVTEWVLAALEELKDFRLAAPSPVEDETL